MTRTLTAHFDGKVIVPDEPVNLPEHQQLVIHVETSTTSTPDGTAGEDMIKLIHELKFDPKQVEEMERSIEQGRG